MGLQEPASSFPRADTGPCGSPRCAYQAARMLPDSGRLVQIFWARIWLSWMSCARFCALAAAPPSTCAGRAFAATNTARMRAAARPGASRPEPPESVTEKARRDASTIATRCVVCGPSAGRWARLWWIRLPPILAPTSLWILMVMSRERVSGWRSLALRRPPDLRPRRESMLRIPRPRFDAACAASKASTSSRSAGRSAPAPEGGRRDR